MSKTINNLKEFLAWRGFGENEARYWARCFYKYTACGPWAVFLMRAPDAAPTEHPERVAKFRVKNGQAHLTNPEELPESFLQLLGFDKHGLPNKDKDWDTYRRLVDEFIAEEKGKGKPERDIEVVRRTIADFWVRIPGWTEPMADYDHEAYYENLGTDDDGNTVTYRTENYGRAPNETLPFDPDLCLGVKFGSIVEGSEVCSGPFTHLFPFETEAFEKDEAWMEKETSFYWKRDNASWYRVVTDKENWIVANVWGDIEWEESDEGNEVPADIKAAAEKAIENDWQPEEEGSSFIKQTIPEEPGYWAEPKKDWEPMDLGVGGATIATFTNDEVL